MYWPFFIALALNTHIFGKPVIRAFIFYSEYYQWSYDRPGVDIYFSESNANNWRTFTFGSSNRFSWFGSSTAAFAAVSVVTVWQGLGFLMILYITGLQSIPLDVMEAACIDGCVGLNRIMKNPASASDANDYDQSVCIYCKCI